MYQCHRILAVTALDTPGNSQVLKPLSAVGTPCVLGSTQAILSFSCSRYSQILKSFSDVDTPGTEPFKITGTRDVIDWVPMTSTGTLTPTP